jgi:S1-C subfamily serine protease
MRQRPVLVGFLASLCMLAVAGLCRADDAKKDDKKSDEPKSGFLGVMIDEQDGKVVISEVIPDSPAAKAGLKSGDVVFKVGKEEIKDQQNLVEMISKHKPGDKVSVVIKRDGKEQTIDVTLGERPND